jgi:hypothetical protein
MKIDGYRYRDYGPKRGLDDKYIGDRYPLCYDLPERPFLRKGAKFRLLGGSNKPILQEDLSFRETVDFKQHISLNFTSNLYAALCNDGGNGCEYPSIVTLDSNLACHGGDLECLVDTARTVEVDGIYYGECLRHASVFLRFCLGNSSH